MTVAPAPTRDVCPKSSKKRRFKHWLVHEIADAYRCKLCRGIFHLSQKWSGVTVTTAAATYRRKPLTLKEKAEKAEQERWLNMKGVLET